MSKTQICLLQIYETFQHKMTNQLTNGGTQIGIKFIFAFISSVNFQVINVYFCCFLLLVHSKKWTVPSRKLGECKICKHFSTLQPFLLLQ